jgi:hypothetical protein
MQRKQLYQLMQQRQLYKQHELQQEQLREAASRHERHGQCSRAELVPETSAAAPQVWVYLMTAVAI